MPAQVVAAEPDGLDRDEIHPWYDGDSWRGDKRVCNPLRRALAVRPPGVPPLLVRALKARSMSPMDLEGRLSSIAHQWHASGDLARHEAWYASLLHMCLRAIGVEVRNEEATGHGRVDMVVEPDDQVFVIAFKRARRAEEAKAALDAAFTTCWTCGQNVNEDVVLGLWSAVAKPTPHNRGSSWLITQGLRRKLPLRSCCPHEGHGLPRAAMAC